MSRYASGGVLGGPHGNGAAAHALVADRFAAADARRREQLDRLCREPVPNTGERLLPKACPACGSKSAHRKGCPNSPREKLKARLAASGKCTRCGHLMTLHRGVVCHGATPTGLRCRCDCGGSP